MIKIHVVIDDTSGDDNTYEFKLEGKDTPSSMLSAYLGYAYAALRPFMPHESATAEAKEFYDSIDIGEEEEKP